MRWPKGSRDSLVVGLALFAAYACGRSIRHEPAVENGGGPTAGGDARGGEATTTGSGGAGGVTTPATGGRLGQGGASRGGEGASTRGGTSSGGNAGEPTQGGTSGTAGEPATAGEGGAAGAGGGSEPCPGRDRWCEGDELHYCDGQSEATAYCRNIYRLLADPPVEATCLEANGDANCAVHVGETCVTFWGSTVYQLPCVEENAACVIGNDTATCVADVGSCTDEDACIGTFRPVQCNTSRPYGYDCRTVDASSTCRIDGEGRTYCANLPLGAYCDSNADGTMGTGFYPGNRCAPGLSCVERDGAYRCVL